MSAVKCAGGCGLVADDEDMWQVTRHPSREVETTTVRTHDGHEWEAQISGPDRVYLCTACFRMALGFVAELREGRR